MQVTTLRAIVTRARSSLRALLISFPTLLQFLFDKEIGGAYGVGVRKKLRLVRAFRRNAKAIEILSSGIEHLELAAAILRVPPSVEGDVIECGCYVGGSSVNLSLTCSLVGRRLVICDSFEGLPEPDDYDREHPAPHAGHTDVYYKGRFAAPLELVKENLGRYGDLSVCEFVVGFFEDTLAGLDRKIVVGFLDVDLIDSLKPCLTAIWPNLQDERRLYVHEARSLSLVSIFFDAPWWQDNLGEGAPGFVGAGSGLPLATPDGSELGYAQKGVVASRVTA
jgi:O-methyltransferase